MSEVTRVTLRLLQAHMPTKNRPKSNFTAFRLLKNRTLGSEFISWDDFTVVNLLKTFRAVRTPVVAYYIKFFTSHYLPPFTNLQFYIDLQRFKTVSETASNMLFSLQHCLTLFHQQEEVRVMQLKQEQVIS